MKYITSLLLFVACSLMAMASETVSSDNDQPEKITLRGDLLFTIHSNLYEEDGDVNVFSLSLGSTSTEGTTVTIETGYGGQKLQVDYATVNDSTMSGTLFTGQVSSSGVVRVYGEPGSIDYINANGCGVTDIEFNNVKNLTYLYLEHNSLEKLNVDTLQNLQALYLMDNPFTKSTPLMIGSLPKLTVLEVGEIDNISDDFTLTNFPSLMAFDAYHTTGLKTCDPSKCPNLVRLSVDMTKVDKLDISQNQKLSILNINDSRISSIDLTKNENLVQLYANHSSGSYNTDVKLSNLDLSGNPYLYVLFAAGNNLETLDISNNPYMFTLSVPNNAFRSMDFSNNPELYSVNISHNDMDFATLPAPQTTWYEYYYSQNDLPLNKSYKVGDVIDLSSRVLRDGYATDCALYYAEKDSPTDFLPVDTDCYSYADGKITLLKTFDLPVFALFTNELFSEYPLYTTSFNIMTEEQFNAKNNALEFASNASVGDEISITMGIQGASKDSPKPLYVDFGDGEMRSGYQAVSENPASANIVGKRSGTGNIKVYTERDEEVISLCTDGLSITNINLGELSSLETLELKNAGLYSIDLSYNANLKKLNLSGNNLSTTSLKGSTPYYYKARLTDVDLSHNRLSALDVDDMYTLKRLNISYNNFTEIDFSDADNILTVDASNNQFTSLTFTNSDSIQSVNAANNNLTSIYVPDDAPLAYLNVSGNKFDFTNIPSYLNLGDENFIYAPQQNVQIGVSSPKVDLSSMANVGDVKTSFVWKNTDGKELTEGTDYEATAEGVFSFLSPVYNQSLYCVMENAAYPQLSGDNALTTTTMKAIGMPQYEVASFTTIVDGETAYMSLAAEKDNTSVFIDWSGEGEITQYLLKSTYTEFTATTKAGARVKVYVNDPADNFSVMSIYNVSMKDFTCNGERLTKLFMLGLEDDDLYDIDLPVLKSVFELKLGNNHFTDFDFSKFPNLYYLSLNGNELTDIDLSKCTGLGWAYLGNNKLNSITFNGNKTLESLDLGGNSFTECPDFTSAPNIGQIWLNNNQLTNVDNVLTLKYLRVLNVANNLLTFATLPLSQWNTYFYNPQADIEATIDANSRVDLSSQAMVDDVATTYRWFIGKPEIDDDTSEFVGDELVADQDYTVENGVTTFLMDNDTDNLVCVMQNDNLPNIILYTTPVNYTSYTGIADINATSTDAPVYNIAGQRVGNTYKGIIVKNGRKTIK